MEFPRGRSAAVDEGLLRRPGEPDGPATPSASILRRRGELVAVVGGRVLKLPEHAPHLGDVRAVVDDEVPGSLRLWKLRDLVAERVVLGCEPVDRPRGLEELRGRQAELENRARRMGLEVEVAENHAALEAVRSASAVGIPFHRDRYLEVVRTVDREHAELHETRGGRGRQRGSLESLLAGGALAAASAGVAHPTYTLAATGRLYTHDPHLQGLDRRLRVAVRPRAGRAIVEVDYATIEPRILAQLSGDSAMRRVFAEGLDFHRQTAAALLGIPPEEVSPIQRRLAKSVSMAVLYGVGNRRLREQIRDDLEQSLSIDEVDRLRTRLRESFPTCAVWTQGLAEGGPFETPGGWVCWPEAGTHDGAVASRVAQATCATGLKRVLVRLPEILPGRGRLLFPVHDALVLECDQGHEPELQRLVGDLMIATMRELVPDVPIAVNAKHGPSWGELTESSAAP